MGTTDEDHARLGPKLELLGHMTVDVLLSEWVEGTVNIDFF